MLIDYITSSPVVAMIIERSTIENIKKLVEDTNSKKTLPGTISKGRFLTCFM